MIVENPEQYLHDTGLLFHMNRTILHPLGLSLAIAEQNIQGQGITSLVLHETADLNGFEFTDADMKQALASYDVFLTERKSRVLTRGKTLGYIQQPTE